MNITQLSKNNLPQEGLYIVSITEDEEKYDYEHSNLDHANEHYNQEEKASLYLYEDEKYYFVKGK